MARASNKSERRLRYLLALPVLLMPGYSFAQGGDPIEVFFQHRSAKAFLNQNVEQETYSALVDNVTTMSGARLRAELPVIDAQIGAAQDRQSKRYAVGLLLVLSTRADRTSVLVGQVPLLSSLLSDPDEVVKLSSLRSMVSLGPEHADLVLPPLREVLVTSASTNTIGPGAASAVMLLSPPNDARAAASVVQFLERSDLSARSRALAISGISSRPFDSAPLTQELLRNLDDPDSRVKVAALVALSKSGANGLALAKPTLERAAGDPHLSDRLRSLAAKASRGPIGDDPEVWAQFDPSVK